MRGHPTVHILSQYLWPDDAPTGIYAEQVADALSNAGVDVRLVGGRGRYRAGHRPVPQTRILHIANREGQRGNLVSTAYEYESVRRGFRAYILSHVEPGDLVVVTSAPPTTLLLDRAIRVRQAVGIYWLQDYYPQLIRGVWDAPARARRLFARYWTDHLHRWPHVVKAAGNLGYSGSNARVIRNWNTLELGSPKPFRPGTVLYAGNLGYGHHLPSFITLCRKLHEEGREIIVRGDGPGMALLPKWINVKSPYVEPADCIRDYWEAEAHLVAGHPELPDAVFPSKFWNAQATGRPVLASGFAGVMAAELEAARTSDFHQHLAQWSGFLIGLVGSARRAGP